MKENCIKAIKWILFFALLYVLYLYYTRPELSITPDNFKKIVRENGYQVFKPNTPLSKIATVSYVAVDNDDKALKVNYISCNNSEECYDFYTKFMDQSSDKHTNNLTRDLRFGKTTAEYQSYISDYTIYLAIYTGNAVVYASNFDTRRDQLYKIFERLFKAPECGYVDAQTFILNLFKRS